MMSREAAVDAALLVIRVVLGVIFIAHGMQKLFGAFAGPGISGFASFLNGYQIPQPTLMAWLTAFCEFVGGFLLIGGLATRIAALAIAGIMVVAIAKVHLRNGFFNSTGGYEFPLALLAMAVAILIAGGGTWSLDALFRKDRFGSS